VEPSEDWAAGWVTTMVWPGATLVTTDGGAVVDAVDDDGAGVDVVEDAASLDIVDSDSDELELEEPSAFATSPSVPVRYTE